jgi:hypothetical protein
MMHGVRDVIISLLSVKKRLAVETSSTKVQQDADNNKEYKVARRDNSRN